MIILYVRAALVTGGFCGDVIGWHGDWARSSHIFDFTVPCELNPLNFDFRAAQDAALNLPLTADPLASDNAQNQTFILTIYWLLLKPKINTAWTILPTGGRGRILKSGSLLVHYDQRTSRFVINWRSFIVKIICKWFQMTFIEHWNLYLCHGAIKVSKEKLT